LKREEEREVKKRKQAKALKAYGAPAISQRTYHQCDKLK
jgi:hypothetical protein